ncbi:RNA-binding S4 domain-containing protein [Polymorphobacter fuscus]|uniref:RNA-binding S4 domain-containing protein n=1 Tax=Sandarakinorhabdus fusca TaxID=1439888 RepID=A0A7C9GPJ8_9SPHN|nr:RNA-binding S4 domain-containing protein [Polymorphobacter fuscus]KAB7647490.1 RNA-binding S4 domain-containing protein [Polymorphobacter fuscus]MQT16750.1 RNA-binding S4 domain-containing protein [Polymorphobacter fuscus]
MVYGTGLRLDKWLWFARLAKSRSAAQTLCESRRLRIDGRVIDRASALVRAGSVVSFPRNDEVIVIKVEGLAERRGPYEEARQLYTDLTRNLGSRNAAPLTDAAASF